MPIQLNDGDKFFLKGFLKIYETKMGKAKGVNAKKRYGLLIKEIRADIERGTVDENDIDEDEDDNIVVEPPTTKEKPRVEPTPVIQQKTTSQPSQQKPSETVKEVSPPKQINLPVIPDSEDEESDHDDHKQQSPIDQTPHDDYEDDHVVDPITPISPASPMVQNNVNFDMESDEEEPQQKEKVPSPKSKVLKKKTKVPSPKKTAPSKKPVDNDEYEFGGNDDDNDQHDSNGKDKRKRGNDEEEREEDDDTNPSKKKKHDDEEGTEEGGESGGESGEEEDDGNGGKKKKKRTYIKGPRTCGKCRRLCVGNHVSIPVCDNSGLFDEFVRRGIITKKEIKAKEKRLRDAIAEAANSGQLILNLN